MSRKATSSPSPEILTGYNLLHALLLIIKSLFFSSVMSIYKTSEHTVCLGTYCLATSHSRACFTSSSFMVLGSSPRRARPAQDHKSQGLSITSTWHGVDGLAKVLARSFSNIWLLGKTVSWLRYWSLSSQKSVLKWK